MSGPVTPPQRAEQWITRLAWIGKTDDPCKVASEAAGLMRELLDERDELLAALKSCDQIIRDVTLMMPERIVQAHNAILKAVAKVEDK